MTHWKEMAIESVRISFLINFFEEFGIDSRRISEALKKATEFRGREYSGTSKEKVSRRLVISRLDEIHLTIPLRLAFRAMFLEAKKDHRILDPEIVDLFILRAAWITKIPAPLSAYSSGK